jgi:hypothetical protein
MELQTPDYTSTTEYLPNKKEVVERKYHEVYAGVGMGATKTWFEGSRPDINTFSQGFFADYVIGKYFSLEAMGFTSKENYEDYGVPLLVKLGPRLDHFELTADIGYTVQFGNSIGGTIGTGSKDHKFFFKLMANPFDKDMKSIQWLLGYKYRVWNKK